MDRLVCLCIFLIASALGAKHVARDNTITYTFSSFTGSNMDDLQLNGETPNLNPNGNNYLEINDAQSGVAGSFFLKDSVPLSGDNGFEGSFSTVFSFEMTNPGGISDEDGVGADGIVFIINGLTNIVGGAGGGMGYNGLGNSVGIEFDSYDNGEPIDINGNHVGIDFNGNLQSVTSVGYPVRWNNNGLHYAWVDYDGASQNLQVRVSEDSNRPVAATLSITVNLISILGTTNAYVGFSAATGSGFENQIINQWTFTNTYAPIQQPPPVAVCGNGIVEQGEQCDGGACCTSTCTFASTVTVCRPSIGPCDPAEYCVGNSATCPADVNGQFESSCVGLFVPLNGTTYSWLNYDVIVFGDINANSGDVEGRVAARNNANFGSFSVGYKTHSQYTDETLPYALIVGENLSWTSGAVYPLPSNSPYGGTPENVYVGGSFTTEEQWWSNTFYTNECGANPGCMNSYFDAAQGCYAGYSSYWASQPENVVHDIEWSGLYITCNDPNANTYYLNLSPAENTEFTWVSLTSCSSNARWVITITGTDDVVFAGGSFPAEASSVVYNIPGVRNVNMPAYQLNGNLVAPYANVNQPSGLIVGKLIAASVSALDQVNKAQCFYSQGNQPPVSHICGNGIVEQGEQCDGGDCCTSSCTFKGTNVTCRPSVGICDIPETCTGSSSTCPPDQYEPYTYVCRPSIGPCDATEYCTGSSPMCPADVNGQFETDCSGLELTINGKTISWLNYDVIVFGDFNVNTGDIEARAAIQSNGNFGAGFSVGYQTHSSPTDETVDDALIVGNNLAWSSGQIYPNGQGLPFGGNEEYMFVGGTFSGPSYLAEDIDGTCSTPGCLNSQFSAIQQCYAGYSATWAAEASNVQTSILYDVLTIQCNSQSSLTYYISLTGQQLSTFQSITINSGCNINARWIFNVGGTGDVTISTTVPVGATSSIIWNVLGSGRTIYLQNSELDGSLVSPYNTMSQATGVVKGKVIVGDVSSSNQINKYRCFQPSN